jgi:hypothetical protein
MQINWRRAIVATLIARGVGIALLIVVVALFAPPENQEAQEFAREMAARIGPVAGFLLCIAGGWWTARTAPIADRIPNGALMGVMAAAFDVALSFTFGGGFALLLVLANAGRIFAGALGGWMATREG